MLRMLNLGATAPTHTPAFVQALQAQQIVDRDSKPANNLFEIPIAEPPPPPKPRRVIPTGSNLLLEDLDAAEYHADPCEAPSLSASLAKVLDTQSPAHAFAAHPRLGGGVHREPTNALARGTLLHACLFDERDRIEVVDAEDWKRKGPRAAKKRIEAAGGIPALPHELAAMEAMTLKLVERFADHGFYLEGRSELSGFWTEELPDGQIVQCRCRFDHLIDGRGRILILDAKSCANAHPEACEAQIDRMGYAIQREAYVSAAEHIWPEMAGRVEFAFLFCELPIGIVTPVTLDGAFRHVGRQRWERALRIWSRCRTSGVWPDYGSHVASPKPWTLNREEERACEEAGVDSGS